MALIRLAPWLAVLAGAAATASDPPLPGQYQATTSGPQAIASGEAAAMPLAADRHQRLTVAVRLGQSRAYRFLVDTGSDRTSVSRQLAGDLGLEERPRALMHSATGPSRVRIARVPELHFGGRSVTDIRAPMLEAGDIGADGILGIDALRSRQVVFDFGRSSLAIHAEKEAALEEGAILVRARRRAGRLVITDAQIDGQRVSVVLDTGSSVSIANSALRRKLERKGAVALGGPIDLVSVTGATLRGEQGSIAALDIGGARLEGLQVVFADAHSFRQLGLNERPALLLGMNALRGFDQVTIDFAAKRLALVLPRENVRGLR